MLCILVFRDALMRIDVAEHLLGHSNAGNNVAQKDINPSDNTTNDNIEIKNYALFENYPNPFNPSTTIKYQIPQDGLVTLKIFDVLGREVKTLVNEYKTQGGYSVSFDASNLPSGMYIYQLKGSTFNINKKMLLLK